MSYYNIYMEYISIREQPHKDNKILKDNVN